MYALLASLPILLTIVLMTAFNVPAKKALPLAWLIGTITAVIFWKSSIITVLATTLYGFLNSLDVLFIVFGAIIIMNTLKKSGGMFTINKAFTSISKDSRIQTIVIGFLFVSFLEGAAGFGTPAALAAPLLVSLGFPPIAAATITLFYDSLAVVTGAVGTPVIMSLTLLDGLANAEALVNWTIYVNAIVGIFVPFIGVAFLTKVFSKDKSFKPAFEVLPFALFTGIVFAISYVMVHLLFSFEFSSLLGSLISLIIVVFAAKKNFLTPKKIWKINNELDENNNEIKLAHDLVDRKISPVKSWLPYILISALLIITRIDAIGLKSILQQGMFVIKFNSILGVDELNYVFKWAYLPGTIFIIISVVTNLLHKMDKVSVKSSWKNTFHQISGATIALFFGVALVQILRFSNINQSGLPSMLMTMAEALSKVGKELYIIISPFIGSLGSFIAGSATVSNVLLTSLQFEVASSLGVQPEAIIAAQTIGASIGNMVCINNAVAVSATLGIMGSEGILIKKNFIPMLIYIILVIITITIGLAIIV